MSTPRSLAPLASPSRLARSSGLQSSSLAPLVVSPAAPASEHAGVAASLTGHASIEIHSMADLPASPHLPPSPSVSAASIPRSAPPAGSSIHPVDRTALEIVIPQQQSALPGAVDETATTNAPSSSSGDYSLAAVSPSAVLTPNAAARPNVSAASPRPFLGAVGRIETLLIVNSSPTHHHPVERSGTLTAQGIAQLKKHASGHAYRANTPGSKPPDTHLSGAAVISPSAPDDLMDLYEWIRVMRVRRDLTPDQARRLSEGDRSESLLHPDDLTSLYYSPEFPFDFAGERVVVLQQPNSKLMLLPSAGTAQIDARLVAQSDQVPQPTLTALILAMLCPQLDDDVMFVDAMSRITGRQFHSDAHAQLLHRASSVALLKSFLRSYLRQLPFAQFDLGKQELLSLQTPDSQPYCIALAHNDLVTMPSDESPAVSYRLAPSLSAPVMVHPPRLHIFAYLRRVLQLRFAVADANESGRPFRDDVAVHLSQHGALLATLLETNIMEHTADPAVVDTTAPFATAEDNAHRRESHMLEHTRNLSTGATGGEQYSLSTEPTHWKASIDAAASSSPYIRLLRLVFRKDNRSASCFVAMRSGVSTRPADSFAVVLPSSHLPRSILAGGVMTSELRSAFDLTVFKDMQHANDLRAILSSHVCDVAWETTDDRRERLSLELKDQREQFFRGLIEALRRVGSSHEKEERVTKALCDRHQICCPPAPDVSLQQMDYSLSTEVVLRLLADARSTVRQSWRGRCCPGKNAPEMDKRREFSQQLLRSLAYDGSDRRFDLAPLLNTRLRLLNLWDLFLHEEGLVDTQPRLSYVQLYECLRMLFERLETSAVARARLLLLPPSSHHTAVLHVMQLVKQQRLLQDGFFAKANFPQLIIMLIQAEQAELGDRARDHDDAQTRAGFTRKLATLVVHVTSNLTARRQFDRTAAGLTLLSCVLWPLYFPIVLLGHEGWKPVTGWLLARSLDHVIARDHFQVPVPLRKRWLCLWVSLLYAMAVFNLVVYVRAAMSSSSSGSGSAAQLGFLEGCLPVFAYLFVSLLVSVTAGSRSTELLVHIKLAGIRRSLAELRHVGRREKVSGVSEITDGETILRENILPHENTPAELEPQSMIAMMIGSTSTTWRCFIVVVTVLLSCAPIVLRSSLPGSAQLTDVAEIAASVISLLSGLLFYCYSLFRLSSMLSEFRVLTSVHERLISTFSPSLFQSSKLHTPAHSRVPDFTEASRHHISLQLPDHVLCYSLLRRYLLTACQSGTDMLTARLLCFMGSAAALLGVLVWLAWEAAGQHSQLRLIALVPAAAFAFVLAVGCVCAVDAASAVNVMLARHLHLVSKAQLDISFSKDELATNAERWSWQMQQDKAFGALKDKAYGLHKRKVALDIKSPMDTRTARNMAAHNATPSPARHERAYSKHFLFPLAGPSATDAAAEAIPAVAAASASNSLSDCFSSEELVCMSRSVLQLEREDRVSIQELERARLMLEGVQHSIQFADKALVIAGFEVSPRFRVVCASALLSGGIALGSLIADDLRRR